ncbi:hypothetical protein B0E46_13285 [Rhodanobacter sp. B04]|jgi:hypothetical protein|uniref:hypothetical protein n=1 Tax=Rhodanobacter sp. B04 TaxID=1945860 RepID=UPI0009843256|nr:hypothetical protein [Rhodanobacter sp. B04]OOG62218.1 hypothetical protein B0E46_13285 [Rhodanobacter sp. B04]
MMDTTCTVTLVELWEWSLPGLCKMAKQGDPDAQRAWAGTLARLLQAGKIPTDAVEVFRQLEAGEEAAQVTHTQKPPNRHGLRYRDQRITLEVQSRIDLVKLVEARRTEWEAEGHAVPQMPTIKKTIYGQVAELFEIKADRVKEIYEDRGKK